MEEFRLPDATVEVRSGLDSAKVFKKTTMNFKILHEFPDAGLEKAWRDCLTRVEFPSHYNTPEYFLEPYFTTRRPFAVLAFEGEAVTGVLTGLHEGNQVHCGLPSRPQICADPTKDAAATQRALMEGLLNEAGGAELITVFTWPSLELPVFAKRGFRRRQLPGNVVLDLSQGADAVFKQFSKDRRRNIRFAEKNGIEVQLASTPQDIAEAYEVYQAWRGTDRKELRGTTFTADVFTRAALLTTSRRLFLARLSGKVIAMNIFRLCPGGLFESAANSSLDEFMHLKPNELMQWRGIEWACSQGLRRHSLGGSHQFLLRFGGTVVPIIRYRLDRSWFRKHDVRDAVRDLGRQALRKMPPAMEKKVRALLGED
jgi:Acetyltransferase (GNAT) domain